MIVTNNQPEQYSLEVPLASGTVIRELIQPGCTLIVLNIDPYDINRNKLLRNEVFSNGHLSVRFECEPDDLICLLTSGINEVRDEGVTVATGVQVLNFVGPGVVAADAGGNVTDVTVTSNAPLGVITVDDFREYVVLSGVQNGVNLIFTIPDKAIHDPPKLQLKVYRNGVLQHPGIGNDYVASESGGAGTGFDTITLAAGTAPIANEKLWANYVLFGT